MRSIAKSSFLTAPKKECRSFRFTGKIGTLVDDFMWIKKALEMPALNGRFDLEAHLQQRKICMPALPPLTVTLVLPFTSDVSPSFPSVSQAPKPEENPAGQLLSSSEQGTEPLLQLAVED